MSNQRADEVLPYIRKAEIALSELESAVGPEEYMSFLITAAMETPGPFIKAVEHLLGQFEWDTALPYQSEGLALTHQVRPLLQRLAPLI